MEIPATVYYARFDSDEEARGTLFLVNNNSIVFVTRRLPIFRRFDRHHEYDKSQILKVEAYSDGFETTVQFPETDDEPEEEISYFYEIDRDVDDWIAALSHPKKVESRTTETSSKPEQLLVTSHTYELAWRGEPSEVSNQAPSLENFDSKQFEEFVAELFRRMGYTHVQRVGGPKDHNVDIVAQKEDDLGFIKKWVIQCKHYAADKKIGGPDIALLATTAEHEHNRATACFVTSSSFTEDAIVRARSHEVRLINRADLLKFAKQYNVALASSSPDDRTLAVTHMFPQTAALRGNNGIEPQTMEDRGPQTELATEPQSFVDNLGQVFIHRWDAWDLSEDDKKAIAIIGLSSASLFLFGLASLSRGLILIGVLGLGVFLYSSDRRRLKRLREALHQE